MFLLRSCLPQCWLLSLLLLAGCVSPTAPDILYKDVTPPRSASLRMAQNHERPVVALALGSGGIRGFAHVSAIKVLEANHIPIDIVVGTSVGSVVGALYAGGYVANDLEQLAIQLDEGQLRDISIGRGGFIQGELLQDFINRVLDNRNIEQLPKPFAAVATELDSGKMVVFNRGNTGMAVRASSSIPGVFHPVTISGQTYVDGDLKDPVPVSLARRMGADIVIAIDISQRPEDHAGASGIIDMLTQSIRIMRQSILVHELKGADVVIHPPISVSSFDFSPASKQALFKAGEDAAEAALPQIREQLQRAAQRKRSRPH
jgi:NTE family protein